MSSLTFHAPLQGLLIPLDQVKDEAFAQKMLGDGFAIIPEYGKVVSPVEGKVVALFPTGHAVGIQTSDGVEILIHVGFKTFQLHESIMQPKVAIDDEVHVGDTLIIFNLEKMFEDDYDPTTSIVFTSGEKVDLMKPNQFVVFQENDILSLSK